MRRRHTVLAAIVLSSCGSSVGVATLESDEVLTPIADDSVPIDMDAVEVEVMSNADESDSVDESSVPVEANRLRSFEECSIVSRTLETAIEAHFAEEQHDITSAQDLVRAGYPRELDPDFVIDFTGFELRTADGLDGLSVEPLTSGRCDLAQ